MKCKSGVGLQLCKGNEKCEEKVKKKKREKRELKFDKSTKNLADKNKN